MCVSFIQTQWCEQETAVGWIDGVFECLSTLGQMNIDHFYKLMTVFTKEGMLRIGRDDFRMNCHDFFIDGCEIRGMGEWIYHSQCTSNKQNEERYGFIH